MTPAAFKRWIRDLQVWCSSCMVAFAGSDPIGVLIGAKRPSGTLIYRIAVHPDHLRQGHGRHLLTSLSSKLAILGPPRLVAEVPETLAPACGLFNACGYIQEALLTDYVLEQEAITGRGLGVGSWELGIDPSHRFVIPVTVDDLAANGLYDEASLETCWARAVESVTATEGRDRRPRHRLRRANRGLRAVRVRRPDGRDCGAPHVYRGRWSPRHAIAVSTHRARPQSIPVPEGPRVGDLSGVAGGARFPPHWRTSTLCSAGAVELSRG